MSAPFALTDGLRAACDPLFAHIESRIKRLQLELEQPDRTEKESDVLRGHIRGFRELLKLQQPPKEFQESPPGH